MADRDEMDEYTNTKRVRLSSDASLAQNISYSDDKDKFEPEKDFRLQFTATGEGDNSKKPSSESTSREQHVGHGGQERRQIDDFPTCFSVEEGLDDIDEHHYQPVAGPMGWIEQQMSHDVNPEDILTYMIPHAQLPPNLDKTTLWKIIIDILTEPSPRQKLDHFNTLDDVVELLKGSKNIVVLTGAGVSVSCGIPDFRSRDGIYAKLSVEYPDLPDPQAMFDISYFCQNPRPFYKFAKEIYPGKFKPSRSHRFIRQLELNGQLLKNYTQNIDTLEQIAGISRVIQCHGSFSTASCTNCKYQVSCEAIRDDIFNQVIPLCPKCPQDGNCFAIMKPDIVFFGESLPSEFYHNLDEDSEKADLLIVIGSSLKVRPVALIPSHVPPEVPQVLINREPLRHLTFDVELLGDCDVIISELCQRLGETWSGLSDDLEIPCVKRLRSLPAKLTSDEERIEERGHSLGEKETSENVPNNEDILPDEAQVRDAASTPNQLDGHVTVGESSGCSDTGNELNREHPRASASGEENKHPTNNDTICEEDFPRFIFKPPSRYIFYGAELMDSPFPSPSPSPSRNMTSFLDSTSEESDSDSVGEIDDNEAGGDQLDGVIEDVIGVKKSIDNGHQTTANNGISPINHSIESGNNSDDGFGEGDVEKALGTSNSDVTKQTLSLILGGLSSYTCASEENSRLSAGSDDPASAGSGDSCYLSKAAKTLLTDRPFSVVTMGTTLTKRECLETEHQHRLKKTKTGDSEDSQWCDDSVQPEAEVNTTNDDHVSHS